MVPSASARSPRLTTWCSLADGGHGLMIFVVLAKVAAMASHPSYRNWLIRNPTKQLLMEKQGQIKWGGEGRGGTDVTNSTSFPTSIGNQVKSCG